MLQPGAALAAGPQPIILSVSCGAGVAGGASGPLGIKG